MKAEIGFAFDANNAIDDTRLRMEIVAQSESENTVLRTMAKRMGWKYDWEYSRAYIDQPEPGK